MVIMANKQCFIVMPIKSSDTELFGHFKNVYETMLAPCLREAGYSVLRGDERSDSGAITSHIIKDLSEAALVVADLTTLNANVLYELGIRHTLRKHGTILLIDTTRTTIKNIPFNLKDQRYIEYEGSFAGIGLLKPKLEAAIKAAESGNDTSDNIVHSNLPHLPNDLTLAPDDRSQQLMNQVTTLQSVVEQYKDQFGTLDPDDQDAVRGKMAPAIQIGQIATDVRHGRNPMQLADACLEAAKDRDFSSFVETLDKISQLSTFFPTAKQYSSISAAAISDFESRDLALATLDLAKVVYPEDETMQSLWLALMRDGTADERLRAKKEMERILGFNPASGSYDLKDIESERGNLLIYFDLLIRVGDFEGVHALCDALELQHGTRCLFFRERARAIEGLLGETKAMTMYRRAVLARDADDTAAIWYGNTLNNMREYVNSAEAYLLACKIDPNDGNGFAHAAQAIVRYEARSAHFGDDRVRRLPVGITHDEIRALFAAAVSCGLSQAILGRLGETAQELSSDLETMLGEAGAAPMSRGQRLELATDLYALFASETTTLAVGEQFE